MYIIINVEDSFAA